MIQPPADTAAQPQSPAPRAPNLRSWTLAGVRTPMGVQDRSMRAGQPLGDGVVGLVGPAEAARFVHTTWDSAIVVVDSMPATVKQ